MIAVRILMTSNIECPWFFVRNGEKAHVGTGTALPRDTI